jgi:hypothetical protein
MEVDGLFGHVNNSIRGLATEGPLDQTWEFICECPDADCHEMVSVTLLEFDECRAASPAVPILAEHHVVD